MTLQQEGRNDEVIRRYQEALRTHPDAAQPPEATAAYLSALAHRDPLLLAQLRRTLHGSEASISTPTPTPTPTRGGRLFASLFPLAAARAHTHRSTSTSSSSNTAAAAEGPAPELLTASTSSLGALGTRNNPAVVTMSEPSVWSSFWKTIRGVASLVLMLSFFSVLIDERASGGVAKNVVLPGAAGKGGVDGDGKMTSFQDVKGVDEAKEELQEVVAFLKDPSKFTRLGGKVRGGWV